MRVLVTAATKHGATREIAQVIGDALRDQGLDPTVIEPEQVDTVDDYDAVVLGSAVYAGHWLKPAKQLVDRCGGALTGRRPVAVDVVDRELPFRHRPSLMMTPRTWPRSSPPPERGGIGCSPAS